MDYIHCHDVRFLNIKLRTLHCIRFLCMGVLNEQIMKAKMDQENCQDIRLYSERSNIYQEVMCFKMLSFTGCTSRSF